MPLLLWLDLAVLKVSKQYCSRVNSHHFILTPPLTSPRWTRHNPELVVKWDRPSSMEVMLMCAEHAYRQAGESD